MIKVLDLFSGIGGFAYASERIVGGFETVAFCEIDPFCQKVLKKNFPGVPIHNDIKELEKNAIRYRGYVDVVCGGFPCQPWSNAGKKEGHEDKKGRDLWGEMASIIKQILPRFVIGENVRGFAQMPMGLQRSVNDLESLGYRVANFIIPSAYALGLPHRRERCWIIAEYVADTNNPRQQQSDKELERRSSEQFDGTSIQSTENVSNTSSKREWSNSRNLEKSSEKMEDKRSKFADGIVSSNTNVSDTNSFKQECFTKEQIYGKSNIQTQSSRSSKETQRRLPSLFSMGNVANGISQRLGYDYTIEPGDLPRTVKKEEKRADKLKALGNSIIPQCVAVFFQSIKDCYCEHDR